MLSGDIVSEKHACACVVCVIRRSAHTNGGRLRAFNQFGVFRENCVRTKKPGSFPRETNTDDERVIYIIHRTP